MDGPDYGGTFQMNPGKVYLTDAEYQELIDADTFLKLSLPRTGADAVCEPIEIRKSYCTYITTLLKLWKFLDRDDITQEVKQS